MTVLSVFKERDDGNEKDLIRWLDIDSGQGLYFDAILKLPHCRVKMGKNLNKHA